MGYYSGYLRFLIAIKNYTDARKTLKHIKFYKLDSQNATDVVSSLGREGYRKHLPKWCKNFFDYVHENEVPWEKDEYFSNFIEDKKLYEDSRKMTHMFYYVGKICLFKHQILKHFEPQVYHFEWAHLHLTISLD